MSFNAVIYTVIIDPLLSGLRRAAIDKIDPGSKVIDIACGPGTLAMQLAVKASSVTGIDLDANLISYAAERAAKRGIWNISFESRDASHLSAYRDAEFDIAVTSMAVHQFPEELALGILREMKRIAGKVIIADYNCPMPRGFSGSLAYGIERIAKGDHYRNFRNYMSRGGLQWFTSSSGLELTSEIIRGNGVFVVGVCK